MNYNDAYKKYGSDFKVIISKKIKEPIWLIDIPTLKKGVLWQGKS